MMPASLCSATAISTRTATPLPQRNARGRGLLQVRDGVLGRGLALAAPAPLEDFARQVAAPQAEGERQGQDEPAEEDAEGDEHHVAADADLDERRGDREEQDDGARGARQEPRLVNAGVDRG